jgi:hypothetical protein
VSSGQANIGVLSEYSGGSGRVIVCLIKYCYGHFIQQVSVPQFVVHLIIR